MAENNTSRVMFLLSKLSPWTYIENDKTSLAFKTLLALEFLAGSFIIVKTVLFTKKMAEGYKL